MWSGGFVIIGMILSISSNLLRRWLVGDAEQAELSRTGRKVDLWGKVILLLFIIGCIVVMVIEDRLKGAALKWLMIITISLAGGFQTFIDWKYRKGSKEYLAPLIVVALGVTLVLLLL
ncbi:DUF4181 domain-containing protein [Paenibacillus zeisoli]|uniref:DUF4181 domain-containing protein n=1 Tax=Paenibacillus zeisoli TaxID=2496267 RepID=A0A3S1B749_9BACL|nr:DUF4181 domain-containing protein [Paenibacillus zeisoli]RUT33511.1 DUF4181 domain-containing protein [Paenibacillus zeisoli]